MGRLKVIIQRGIKMSKGIKTFFIFLISLAAWFGLLFFTFNFGVWGGFQNLTTGITGLLVVPIIISSIYYFNADDSKKEVKKEVKKSDIMGLPEVKKEPKTLTEKYDVLDSFKVLAFFLMIVSTGFFIYSLVQYFDATKVAREMLENAMITSTITYIITMFSLFCLTKMIDFLFDLDRDKSDN